MHTGKIEANTIVLDDPGGTYVCKLNGNNIYKSGLTIWLVSINAVRLK